MTGQHLRGRARVYRIDAARAAWRQVGQEGVVLDLDQSVYFAVNHSAGLLWPLLSNGATHAELVEALFSQRIGPDSRPRAAAEVTTFLAAVEAEGLLTADDTDG
jgi:Coenzyme PQQ synthesis protein D (PqqD)